MTEVVGVTVIKTHVPLSTVQTCERDLKSPKAGVGSYSMILHDCSSVPALAQDKILAVISKEHEA